MRGVAPRRDAPRRPENDTRLRTNAEPAQEVTPRVTRPAHGAAERLLPPTFACQNRRVMIAPEPARRAARRRSWIARVATLALAASFARAATSAASPAPAASAPPTGPVVVLAAEDDAAPWSYADGSGYVNDLVTAAFGEAGWSVRLKVMPYTRCKALATKGEIAGCFSTSRTPELEADLLYPHEPVFVARDVLVTRPGAPFSGCRPADWPRRPTVGIVRAYEYLDSVNTLFGSGAAQADVTDSEISNLRKLRAGRIDATVLTVDEVKRVDWLARLAGVPAEFHVVCDFGDDPAYVAFSRRHPQGAAALAAFDEGYARLKRHGGVAALQAAWRARALDAAAAKPH
jgi:ABC-type amino acid transport substrate-binding protein